MTFHQRIDSIIGKHVYDNQRNVYVLIMQMIGIWAAVTNISRALFRKIFMSPKRKLSHILWEMGRDEKHFSGFFIDRISSLNHHIKVDAASSMALDTMYDWDEKIRSSVDDTTLAGKFERFWFDNSENRRSLKSRKLMVDTLLVSAIDDFLLEPEVRIISVACGSARAVIEAMQSCEHPNVQVTLIDRDPKALENARKNIEKAGLENRFQYVCAGKSHICEVAKDFAPHIVEMVGLMDYLTTSQGTDYSAKVHNVLMSGGYFLTGNIHHNPEKIFLDWGLLWPMIYKTQQDLQNIILGGGFTKDKTKVLCEPLGIHGLSFAQK